MPIRVHCPNGCLLRMPADRAGKIVRCPGCKATIALPPITLSEEKSGKPIPLLATLVTPVMIEGPERTDKAAEADSNQTETNRQVPESMESLDTQSEQRGVQEANEIIEISDSDSVKLVFDKLANLAGSAATEPAREEQDSGDRMPEVSNFGIELEAEAKALGDQAPGDNLHWGGDVPLEVPFVFSPFKIRETSEAYREQQQHRVANFFDASASEQTVFQSHSIRSSDHSDQAAHPGKPSSVNLGQSGSLEHWRGRLREANSSRITLAKVLALVILALGIVNMAPAIALWFRSWSALDLTVNRWIYLQVFVASLYFLYSLLIFQVPDWSSLRAISVVMLAMAFGYGLISAGLLLEWGNGSISYFLGLPPSMIGKATLWSVSMLCLATLLAYISGKEAHDWCRAEQLLVEFLDRKVSF